MLIASINFFIFNSSNIKANIQVLCFFLLFYCIFHRHLVPLCPLPGTTTTLISMSMSPFFFLLNPSTPYLPFPQLSSCSPRWIKYLNVKGYKAFTKYSGVYLHDIRLGKEFLEHKSRIRTRLMGSNFHALLTMMCSNIGTNTDVLQNSLMLHLHS